MNRPLAWLFARGWMVAAWLAVLFGMKRRARELYEQIVRLEPGDADARSALGNLQAELGDKVGAIASFVELVERHPQNAEAWFNLGFLYESRDELEPAERCFRRAIALQESLDRAWYGLGLVLIRRGRLQEAVPVLKKNTELQPFSPYGFYQLGMTYHHLGQGDDAWRVVATLKKFEPRYAATLKRDLENTPASAPEPAPRTIRLDKEAFVSAI